MKKTLIGHTITVLGNDNGCIALCQPQERSDDHVIEIAPRDVDTIVQWMRDARDKLLADGASPFQVTDESDGEPDTD